MWRATSARTAPVGAARVLLVPLWACPSASLLPPSAPSLLTLLAAGPRAGQRVGGARLLRTALLRCWLRCTQAARLIIAPPAGPPAGHVEVERYLERLNLPYTVFQPLYIYGDHTNKDCEQVGLGRRRRGAGRSVEGWRGQRRRPAAAPPSALVPRHAPPSPLLACCHLQWFMDRILRGRPVPIPAPGLQLTSLSHVEVRRGGVREALRAPARPAPRLARITAQPAPRRGLSPVLLF